MSVTRVPIPPIAKGSLTNFGWVLLLPVALAGGTAWAGLQGVPAVCGRLPRQQCR